MRSSTARNCATSRGFDWSTRAADAATKASTPRCPEARSSTMAASDCPRFADSARSATELPVRADMAAAVIVRVRSVSVAIQRFIESSLRGRTTGRPHKDKLEPGSGAVCLSYVKMRKKHPESGTALCAWSPAHVDSLCLGQGFDEDESQPQAGRCVAGGATLKRVEEIAGHTAIDAGPMIAHRQGDMAVHASDLDVDVAVGAGARVLLGVVEQILNDVMDGVPVEGDSRQVLGDREVDQTAGDLERGTELFDALTHGSAEVARLRSDRERAALQPRELEHVRHDPPETVGFLRHLLCVEPRAFRIAELVREHVAVEAQAGQRRAQLVCRGGGELRAFPRQALGAPDDHGHGDERERGGAEAGVERAAERAADLVRARHRGSRGWALIDVETPPGAADGEAVPASWATGPLGGVGERDIRDEKPLYDRAIGPNDRTQCGEEWLAVDDHGGPGEVARGDLDVGCAARRQFRFRRRRGRLQLPIDGIRLRVLRERAGVELLHADGFRRRRLGSRGHRFGCRGYSRYSPRLLLAVL